MAKKGYERIEAVCPYYCYETSGAIWCESPAGENSHCCITFESARAKGMWAETYCVSDDQCREETRRCRLARMLDEQLKDSC